MHIALPAVFSDTVSIINSFCMNCKGFFGRFFGFSFSRVGTAGKQGERTDTECNSIRDFFVMEQVE